MKKIKSLICIILVGLSVSSCKDFLTLMPLNDIVLENFWTDMSDVESVLLGSYSALESSDCAMRMLIWGEMRSDNVVAGSSKPSDAIAQILDDDILSTNDYTKYKCFYDVINRANTVLHFAPEVQQNDPNYSPGELLANEAEAIALRSMAYWYLIRAYKDVPYTTEPSIDDTHNFFIGQTPFKNVLDTLITDLENVKKYAPNKYPTELANTSRFTRASINAMLADMYLWKGDWDKCLECCKEVHAIMWDKYQEDLEKNTTSCMIDLYNGYPLLRAYHQTANGPRMGYSYNEIFGSGNSYETLFELPYDDKVKNPFVDDYYSKKELNGGNLKASKMAAKETFTQKYDGRYYEGIRSAKSDDDYIVKYVYETLEYDLTSGSIDVTVKRKFQNTTRNSSQPNWIIYRYTDVILMEAEAQAMKAKDLKNEGGADVSIDSLCRLSFNAVDAVNRRALGQISGGGYAGADYLVYAEYAGDPEKIEELVLDERHRELMFEGKRWFDLVRKSLRDGNTSYLWKKIEKKFDSSSSNAVRIKMTDLDALFFPINRDEIKINPEKLKQNPVYIEDEFIKKSE